LATAGVCTASLLTGCTGGGKPEDGAMTDGENGQREDVGGSGNEAVTDGGDGQGGDADEGNETATDGGEDAEEEPQTDGGEAGESDGEGQGGENDIERLTATLHTSKGDVRIELYDERAPRTVENFVGLSTGEREWQDPETGETADGEPLYDDVLFHRVIEGFMIQTGDPTGTGRGGPGYTFDDEFHDELRHDGPGVVSMANSGPDTNGSQFFITLEATPHLDDRHSVFGQVVEGMEVVREIGAVETDANDRPVEDVFLESVMVHNA